MLLNKYMFLLIFFIALQKPGFHALMKIVVLGAGVTGIATAWYLRKAGHQVTVIDQREGPGLETSFANGGQISGRAPAVDFCFCE